MAVMLSTLAACSGGGHKAAQPLPAPGPNPDVIPAVITPAYVNAVFRVLNHIYGNALREEVTTRQVDGTVLHDLEAIYSEPQLAVEESIFQQALNGSLNYVVTSPGDRVFTTKALQSAGPRCIQAQELADYSTVDRSRGSNQSLIVVLARTPQNQGSSRNPTPWSISYEKTEEPASTCPT